MDNLEKTNNILPVEEEKSEASAEHSDETKKKEPFSLLGSIYDVVETLAITACAVLLLFTFICRIAVVSGDSMNNTLYDTDRMIVSDLFYTPKCGDIVVFTLKTESGTEKSYIKRVIAVGGQTVDIDFATNTVTVDGKVIDESDYLNLASPYVARHDVEFPLTVPDGYVFVMGDNRNNSLDSRFSSIGCVDERVIFGRVLARLYPLDSISIY